MTTVPASITEQDRTLIKPYVILPMVQAAFERDSNVFLNLKTPDPYVDWLAQARERLASEARKIKNEAFRRGIRMTSKQRIDGGLLVRYQCRGFFGDLALPDTEVAEEAAELMRRLLKF
ncbi:hypothetical protein NSS98_21060 [Paenibacillus sp. FSL E2-0274]|uniref:hypothetical protein n=1 Tax=Paenibacillus TaxID=44249 RepID=UPI00096BD55E|nr:hypothetical protein [Paenibacillus odorifer]OME22208.1 hypothetical protein BSK63_31195 [Paenibacillus odorifer]OME37866.1 hypothetical protein BSK46_14140 [Paenibacillus odorifer]